jgi:protein TonB
MDRAVQAKAYARSDGDKSGYDQRRYDQREMLKAMPTAPMYAVPKIISKGVVNDSAISLPKPQYPATAKAMGAAGPVNVQVTIDEDGNVISAAAVSGHPLLRQAAAEAARKAKFRPTLLSGVPVKVSGVIVYNFVNLDK